MNKRVITLISSGLGSGGSELQLSQLAVGLATQGWHVRVVSLQRGGRYRRALEDQGIEVNECPVGRIAGARSLAQLLRILQRQSPTVIHTQAFRANLWGRLAAILQRRPVVASVRATYSYLPRAYYRVERALSHRTARVIAPSYATAKHLISIVGVPADRVTVIRNGVDCSSFGRSVQRSEFRTRWALEDRFTILAPGRLVRQKNHALLIDAFRLFVLQRPASVLIIAGIGPLEGQLRRRANGDRRIIFAGELDRPAMVGAMAAADVVALASDFEGMPNVLLEAMASARAVIATSVDGTAELVRSGIDGLLVAATANAFAEGFGLLSSSAALRDGFGAAGRRRVEDEFTIEACIQAHVEVYEQILALPLNEALPGGLSR